MTKKELEQHAKSETLMARAPYIPRRGLPIGAEAVRIVDFNQPRRVFSNQYRDMTGHIVDDGVQVQGVSPTTNRKVGTPFTVAPREIFATWAEYSEDVDAAEARREAKNNQHGRASTLASKLNDAGLDSAQTIARINRSSGNQMGPTMVALCEEDAKKVLALLAK